MPLTFRPCGGTPLPSFEITVECESETPSADIHTDGRVTTDSPDPVQVWVTIDATGYPFTPADITSGGGRWNWLVSDFTAVPGSLPHGIGVTDFTVVGSDLHNELGPFTVQMAADGNPGAYMVWEIKQSSDTDTSADPPTLTFSTSYWADAAHTILLGMTVCTSEWDSGLIGLSLPPPSGDIVDIDAVWDASIHNPLAGDLTGLTFRLTATQELGVVLTSDLAVSATGLTMTATQDGDAAVWESSPFTIPAGGDFALHVTITHDDDSVLSGTVDLLGELLSASDAVLASSSGTLTIEV